ncbi:MAG: M23 family metallopeptidase [Neomegalonema sp.]|nr:M23 family metallopeptidase [Neomegalonema sp.]
MSLCRGIPVSNAPRHDTERRLLDYTPFAALSDGRPILRAPVSDACLSSGFGIRGGREHKGIDLHQRPAGPVVAAAAGRIREIHRRDDFGLQIILDHGKGVFTRYAHLASFAPDLRVGSVVKMGQELGIMGRSGQFTRGVHLHFELLKGRYDTPYKSFGLTAHSVLALPAYRLGSQPNGATPSG